MRSIKFNEAELEFLVGQYELELIEAEKYVGEIKNILNKLGVISKDVSGKKEIKKKRGRGRPAKAVTPETKQTSAEKSAEPKKKSKGKPGRPKKNGRKKGSKRKPEVVTKPLKSDIAVVTPAKSLTAPKRKAKTAPKSKAKTAPKKKAKTAPKKKIKTAPKKKIKTAPANPAPKKSVLPESPLTVVKEEKPAEV